MAVSFYKAIRGNFAIIGKQADGDSIRFIADDPNAYTDLYHHSRIKPNREDNSVQLRFESIDAPELHYGKFGQPMADTARDAALETLGFTQITYYGHAVSSATPRSIAGTILTKGADANGRPICYVLKVADSQLVTAGKWIFVDEKILERTVNKSLLASGLVYYTAYTSTPKLHRDYFRKIANQAREKLLGLWSVDATSDFILEKPEDIDRHGSLILPKLFRRCADYLQAKKEGFAGELEDWLREQSSRLQGKNDLVLLEPSGANVNFSSLIKQHKSRVYFGADILQITFVNK